MKLYKEGSRAASLGAPLACEMSKDHRNRFIRFRLYSSMRLLLAFLALIPLQAMSLKDFNAKADRDQAVYVVNFIEKMSGDLGAKNPQLARDIRDWFSRRPVGKPISAGMERLYVELGAIEIQAKDGKADLSKIQLESVIVWVVKQYVCPSKCTVDRLR
jgi:hypothetical protein